MNEQKRVSGAVCAPDEQRDAAHSPEPAASEHFVPVACRTRIALEDTNARWRSLATGAQHYALLMDGQTVEQISCFQRNIENFLGTVKIPVGLAGPLQVNGRYARGNYAIPLATSEAALVASYHRGTQLITEAGGCTALVLDEGVGRTPGFAFRTLTACAAFADWAQMHLTELQQEARCTTQHGQLIRIWPCIEGNHLYLHLDFHTADAAGQNMVTIASEAICAYLLQRCPIQPLYSFVEANFSGDKKASARSLHTVRGKRVSAEVYIPAELVRKRLHTTPQRMQDYWRTGTIGAVLSGTIGIQGHFANGLAALYIACGQDAACIAESAIGITRFEVTPEGALYASVTLPNLIVGTVGGGTDLPGQRACLDILGLAGAGHARAFAEVCAGLCLAGEISLVAALCAGHFARAHKRLARGRAAPEEVPHG
jgi:hydroxymethylglutaryl-CoA reductase (NADPH)